MWARSAILRREPRRVAPVARRARGTVAIGPRVRPNCRRKPLTHPPAERPLALPDDAPTSWVDALTSAPVEGSRVFGVLPVSLLVGSR